MKLNRYCLGFLFNEDCSEVLLIRKQRPNFQRGRWNGLGGLAESGEGPRAAMVRQTKEESGIVTAEEDWRHLNNLEFPTASVSVFFASCGDLTKARTCTDEIVQRTAVASIPLLRTCSHVQDCIDQAIMRMRAGEEPGL